MKRWVVVIAVLFASFTVSRAQGAADTHLVDAVTLYSNGQFKQAAQLLQTISHAAPDNDAVWYYLGLSRISLKELDGAQEALEKAVALDSSNFWYRRSLAYVQVLQGKLPEGTAQYEALVKDFPQRQEPSFELLELYLNQKEYEKALQALDDIRRQRGPSEELVRTKHNVLMALNRPEEAVQELESFCEDYSSPGVLTMLGDYYLSEYKDSLADARYSQALELDSGYVPAVLGRSEVYRHARKYPEYFATLHGFFVSEDVPVATKSMYIGNLTRSLDPKILQLHREGFDSLVKDGLETHPTDSTLLSTAGSYYYSTGRPKEAGQWFRKVADEYPQSISHAATYIQYLNLQEEWEDMRDRAMEAYNRFGELGFLEYANLASYQLKDYDAIIGNCQRLLLKYAKDKDICLNACSMMGDAYHSKGDAKQAYKAYDKALRINSSYAPVLNNYAYYLSLEGKQLKKAYTMSKKTVEAEPDNATYLDTFAWILHLMGKDLEAKPFFKHAMLYGGKDSPVILDHYAEVLYALGEYDMARLYWRQAKGKNTGGEIPDLEERVNERLKAIEKL